MNPVNLYISTCRCVIQANPYDVESWADPIRLMPYLRQALSCCVCGDIISNPIGPRESVCQHHVCTDCRGGKMRLRPSCSWCKDHDNFVENEQLRILVQCFKKLCEYVSSSPVAAQLSNSNNGANTALMSILQEGKAIKDTYTMSPGPKLPVLAPILQRVGKNIIKKESSESDVTDLAASLPSSIASKEFNSCRKPTSNSTENGLERTVSDSKSSVSNASNGESGEIDTGYLNGDHMDTESDDTEVIIGNHHGHGNSKKSESTKDVTVGNHNSEINDNQFSPPLTREERLSKTVAAEHDYTGFVDEQFKRRTHVTIAMSKTRKGQQHKDNDLVILSKRIKESNNDECDALDSPGKSRASRQKNRGHGCRCGLATPNPGKLTCCGQRCPCYSTFKGCVDCRCRGCRNPRGDPGKAILLPSGLYPVHIQTITPIKREENGSSDIEIDI